MFRFVGKEEAGQLIRLFEVADNRGGVRGAEPFLQGIAVQPSYAGEGAVNACRCKMPVAEVCNKDAHLCSRNLGKGQLIVRKPIRKKLEVIPVGFNGFFRKMPHPCAVGEVVFKDRIHRLVDIPVFHAFDNTV